jgi:hypothetical protein
MRNNVFHACLQFSNIASVPRDTRRRIVQELLDCRRCKLTKSPPPKRFVICCAIQDQTVVIYAPLNFLGRGVLQRHLERRATQERTRCREAA